MILHLNIQLISQLLFILQLVSFGFGLKLSHRKVGPVLFPVHIGNPNQTIYTSLTFEFQSSYFLGDSSYCSGEYKNDSVAAIKNSYRSIYCTGYNPDISITYTELSNENIKNITIGNESGTYYKVSDNVSIGEMNFSNNFYVESSGNISKSIMSISKPLNDIDRGLTFSENLYQKGLSKINSVAIWLGQDDFTGIVTFGGIYRSLLKEANIKEFSSVYFSKNDYANYLTTPLEQVRLISGGFDYNLRANITFRDANYFYFPRELLHYILVLYNVNGPDKNGEYIVDCQKARSMAGALYLTFPAENSDKSESKEMRIPLSTFYVHPYYNGTCALPIGSTTEFEDVEKDEIVIGLYAAHWYYLVFDYTSNSFSFANVEFNRKTYNKFILFQNKWNDFSLEHKRSIPPDLQKFIGCLLAIAVIGIPTLLISCCVRERRRRRRNNIGQPPTGINVNRAFELAGVDRPAERQIPQRI